MKNTLRIKEILKEKGVTINELANQLQINRVNLSKMINGNPTLDTLEKIATELGMEIKDLFCYTNDKPYTLEKNSLHNIFVYEDKYVRLQANLPHINNFNSTFYFEIKKGFSIVPSSAQIQEFFFDKKSTKSLEERLFRGNTDKHQLLQLFSTFMWFDKYELDSFLKALRYFIEAHELCYNEGLTQIGANYPNFNRIDSTNDFVITKLDRSLWEKLIKLTKYYDLDTPYTDFEKFNGNGYNIDLYNPLRSKDVNTFKMQLFPIDDYPGVGLNEIAVKWGEPMDIRLIKSKEVFSVKESYDFLFKRLIPKADKMF